MMLDDVYGSDPDRFPLEQEAAEDAFPELEWDESEAQSVAAELAGRQTLTD